jgi:carbonic anhydrase
MRLLEAILDANHRALAGDSRAGLHPSDFPDALPLVALTCIDPRLNHLMPEVLGIREEDFIWLRNAGNIVFDPLSGIMRSLALACAIKGGKEIAIIGHTDCRVRQVSVSQLIESFRALGIPRAHLPENLVEFFGIFASERQNVINGAQHVRQSPLISPQIPVHGLLVEIETGRLEWVVNGYEQLGAARFPSSPLMQKVEQAKELIGELKSVKLDEIKFPEVKIGEFHFDPNQWRSDVRVIEQKVKEGLAAIGSQNSTSAASAQKAETEHRPIPIPPPIAGFKKKEGKSREGAKGK